MSVTVKYMGQAHSAPAGDARALKLALVAPTGLASDAMKLIRSGKVLADADVVAAGAKVMLMRCAPPPPEFLRLSVREIVTGRLAPGLKVAPATTHDQLVAVIVKALALPPCDEQTEVRIFLPEHNVLMRQDLSLADYPLSSPAAGRDIDIFAVPCPKTPDPQQAAQLAQELREAAAAELTPHEASHALQELAAHASATMAPHDAHAMRTALGALLAPPAGEAGEAGGEAAVGAAGTFMLPPSLADAADGEAAGGLVEVTPSTAESVGRCSGGGEGARRPSGASLVPTRLRSGLMPAHDEPPPVSIERPLASLLAAELEAYEQACAPPTAEEWAAYVSHEEERLEGRCADLIRSLRPSRPPPRAPPKRRAPRRMAGTLEAGFATDGIPRRTARPRRSRSAPHLATRAPRRSAEHEMYFSSSASSATSADSPSSAASLPLLFGEEEEWMLLAAECAECEDAEAEAAAEGAERFAAACAVGHAAGDGAAEMPKGGAGGKVHGSACRSCGCRLPLTACAAACRCGHTFCPTHMHEHACCFDYKSAHNAKVRKDNPKLEGPKLERM